MAPRRLSQKSSSSGNRTPGVCVTGRNVTNYTNEEEKGTTGIEPVTAGSAIPCSTAELSPHIYHLGRRSQYTISADWPRVR